MSAQFIHLVSTSLACPCETWECEKFSESKGEQPSLPSPCLLISYVTAEGHLVG